MKKLSNCNLLEALKYRLSTNFSSSVFSSARTVWFRIYFFIFLFWVLSWELRLESEHSSEQAWDWPFYWGEVRTAIPDFVISRIAHIQRKGRRTEGDEMRLFLYRQSDIVPADFRKWKELFICSASA